MGFATCFDMDLTNDMNDILNVLEDNIRNAVNYRYVETINRLGAELNNLLQTALSSSNVFDTSINNAIMEAKVKSISHSKGTSITKEETSDSFQSVRSSMCSRQDLFNDAEYGEDGLPNPNTPGYDEAMLEDTSSLIQKRPQNSYKTPTNSNQARKESNVPITELPYTALSDGIITDQPWIQPITGTNNVSDKDAVYKAQPTAPSYKDQPREKEQLGYAQNPFAIRKSNISTHGKRANPYNYTTELNSQDIKNSPFNGKNNQYISAYKGVKLETGKEIDRFRTTAEKLPNGLVVKTYHCNECDFTCTYNTSIHKHVRHKHDMA